MMTSVERQYVHAEQHMQASILPFLNMAADVKKYGKKRMLWKGHSMGCYLLLSIADRLHEKNGDVAGVFSKIILDAPDVPTWSFVQIVEMCASLGVEFLHMYSPNDKAVDASRVRRAIEPPCPGNGVVVVHDRIQPVNCTNAVSNNALNHDYGKQIPMESNSYGMHPIHHTESLHAPPQHHVAHAGRRDGFTLMDQRDFLAGIPPKERLLDFVVDKESGFAHWDLRTGR